LNLSPLIIIILFTVSYILLFICSYYPKQFNNALKRAKALLTNFFIIISITLLFEILLITFLSFTNLQIFPDILNLKNVTNPESYFDIIIGSLASLSGIVIAVLLIVFEFLSVRFKRSTRKYFLQNINIFFISMLFIITITSSFFSKLIYHNLSINNLSNILYFNSILFITSISFIIPLSISALLSLSYKNIIYKEINRINTKTIKEITLYHQASKDLNINFSIENNPFVILQNIAIQNVKKDSIIVQSIINELTNKYIELISSNKTQKGKLTKITPSLINIYYEKNSGFFLSYILFTNQIFEEILQEKSYMIIEDIGSSLFRLIVHSIENKIHIAELTNILEFIDKISTRLIKENKNRAIEKFINKLKNVMMFYLDKNRLKDEEINIIYIYLYSKEAPKKNKDTEEKWRFIQDYFLKIFFNGLKYSLQFANSESFVFFTSTISIISYEINSSDIEKLQKDMLLVEIYRNLSYSIINKIKTIDYDDNIQIIKQYVIGHFILLLIEENSHSLQALLKIVSNFTLQLQELDKLEIFEVGRFASYLSFALIDYKKDIDIENAYHYILEVILILKKDLENDLESNKWEYSLIKERIQICISQAEELSLDDIKIELKKIHNSFKKIPLGLQDLQDNIQWKNKNEA